MIFRARLLASTGTALLMLLMLTGQAAAQVTPADETSPADVPQAEAQTVDDDIVVTGIRRSIQAAIDTKRDAVGIVDSISAQDIGKLPDQNVVDSLSRIPGLQITRFRGEGADFTIRGISLNNTLINGRTFIGANAGSSARLDVIASDIIAGVDVYKSPTADQIEGALGGTVDLRTKRPLDLPDGTVALRAQGQYGDLNRNLGFRGSALYSTRFGGDKLGLLVNVAYQALETEQQRFEVANYTRVSDIDGTGDGVNDANLFRPARLQLIRVPRRVERLTFNGSFQAKPTDELELLLEGTYNKFEAKGRPVHQQILLNSNDVGARIDDARTVVSGTFNGVTLRPLVFEEEDESDVFQIGSRAIWEKDRLKIVADGSYGRGESPIDAGTFTFVIAPRPGRTANVTYDFAAGTDLPNYALTSNFDINDPEQYRVASISENSNIINNEGYAGRLDLTYDAAWGPLASFDFGYRHEDRSFDTARRVQAITLPEIAAVADANRDGSVTPGEIPALSYTGLLDRGVFPGSSGDFPSRYLTGRVDASAARSSLGYEASPISPTSVSQVTLTTNAIYAKANLKFDLLGVPMRGNVGARYIWTSRSSSGNVVSGAQVLPVTFSTDYTDFLPSATLVADLTDTLVLRLSAARVVASPPLSDLSAGSAVSIVSNTGTGGNPLLDPYRAEQADLSVEWYFANASLLAVSLFHKTVGSFTRSVVTSETIPGFINPNGTGNVFQITRPENGEDGSVSGFEVNYQHALSFLPAPFDGLGVQANYTYADSSTPTPDELTGNTLPLPSLSTHSYSLIGYYEKGAVQGRVAYTFRSDYLLAIQSASLGGSRYVDNQTQLDATLSYNLTDTIKLTVDGQNLLRRPERRFDGVSSRLNSLLIDDRRFFFGFSATF